MMTKKSVSLLLATAMVVLSLNGCSQPAFKNTMTNRQPTSKPVTLTMMCSWNEGVAKEFATAVHEKLPHITVEYEACPIGRQPYADEVTRRVMHNAEADIFMTVGTELWDSGKLLNLTDEEFVSRYNLSMMKTLSDDGAVYFVPSIGEVLCYIYNAQWLEELELPPPQTLGEMERIFAAMMDCGKPPFIVPYSLMPTQYVKVMLSGYLSTPKGQQWMKDYNQGKTTMAQDEQWQQLWTRIEEMVQKGYLRPEDLSYTEARRLALLQEGGGFMTTFSSVQDRELSAQTKDRFQVLPLVGDKQENQMVYAAPSAFFAVSNRLSKSENKAKRVAAMQVLDFISTAEGQELLQSKNPLAISYLSDTTLPINDKYSNLAEIIKRGAFTQLPMFERGVEASIEDVFGKLIMGKITAEDAINACDKQNADYVLKSTELEPPIGKAVELFPWTYRQSRTEELAITNFCADSIRKAAKTDYALELGTAFRGEFFQGDITTADVASVIRQDKKLYVVEATGQQIWDIIAQGIDKKASSWFIAPSGFRYSYRPAVGNIAGELLELTLEDGKPIDLQKSYTVAVSENQMLEITDVVTFFGMASQELTVTLRGAVVSNIREQGEIAPKLDERIKVATTEK